MKAEYPKSHKRRVQPKKRIVVVAQPHESTCMRRRIHVSYEEEDTCGCPAP
jgi:hypothetical protein